MTFNTISFVSRLKYKSVLGEDFYNYSLTLLSEYVLFSSFVLITLLHNAMRKFGTFFAPPGIYITERLFFVLPMFLYSTSNDVMKLFMKLFLVVLWLYSNKKLPC